MRIKAIQTILLTIASVLAAGQINAASHSSMKEPVQSIYHQYIDIQKALAADTQKDVAAKAVSIAKSIRSDGTKMLNSNVARQAEVLAKARDLQSARKAFKPLSKSLIRYLADNDVHSSRFVEVYCPMAKASWLQTGTVVSNPYFGKSMAKCGTIRNSKREKQ